MSLDLNTRLVTTTPYNIDTRDTVVFVNVVGPSSIILPANGDVVVSNILEQAASINSGLDDPSGLNPQVIPDTRTHRSFYIKDYSGNAKNNPITITSADGKLIDGERFAQLGGGYSHIQVVYDGENWMTIA